jgi:hypothetical protein
MFASRSVVGTEPIVWHLGLNKDDKITRIHQMGSVHRKFRRKGMGLKNEGSIVFWLNQEHKD